MATYTGTLEHIDRLPSSPNGNPRYLLHVQVDADRTPEGDPIPSRRVVLRTAPDSQLAYKLPNYQGQRVKVSARLYYGKLTATEVRPTP